MGKKIVYCTQCGKDFEKYESKIAIHNFCNRECYNKYHSKDVPTCKCEICGKIFKGSKTNANRFCSRECYNTFHNIKNKDRECPCCKKIFTARASDDKYCSNECRLKKLHENMRGENHPNWKGGVTSENEKLRKSQDYKEWQQRVYQRDHYKCKVCESKKDINAHHIYGWKEYPEKRFDIENGITLCKECHIKVHQKYGWSSTEKMIPDMQGMSK